MSLDLNRRLLGLRLASLELSSGRRSRLTLCLNLSLLLSIQRPDLSLDHLLLLRRHPNATLTELLLKCGGKSLLL